MHLGVLGDGNCFYRALIVGYLIQILSNENHLKELFELLVRIENNVIVILDLKDQETNVEIQEKDRVKVLLMTIFLKLYITRKGISSISST